MDFEKKVTYCFFKELSCYKCLQINFIGLLFTFTITTARWTSCDIFSFSPAKPKDCLKVVSTTFLLVCFLSLKESTCKTRKNVFYFTSKALFVLETIKL